MVDGLGQRASEREVCAVTTSVVRTGAHEARTRDTPRDDLMTILASGRCRDGHRLELVRLERHERERERERAVRVWRRV